MPVRQFGNLLLVWQRIGVRLSSWTLRRIQRGRFRFGCYLYILFRHENSFRGPRPAKIAGPKPRWEAEPETRAQGRMAVPRTARTGRGPRPRSLALPGDTFQRGETPDRVGCVPAHRTIPAKPGPSRSSRPDRPRGLPPGSDSN